MNMGISPGMRANAADVQTAQNDQAAKFDKAAADVKAQRDDGQVKLKYDISNGTLEVDPGRADNPPYTLPATSGKDACMNDPECVDKLDEGPIPPGDYQLKTNEIDDATFPRDVGRLVFLGEDWGDFRVPVKPTGDTDMRGRGPDDFFIHGGMSDGSAGCIDVGGGLLGNAQTDKLQDDLQGDADGVVELEVVTGEQNVE